MNILDCQRFTNFLSEAVDKKSYLTMQGTDFHLTAEKGLKNLNTSQITHIANQCLQVYVDSQANPIVQYKEIGLLVSSLKAYSSRVIQSKPWYWRILAYLGIRSGEEYQLSRAIYSLQAEQYKRYQDLSPELRILLNETTEPFNFLCNFYCRILSSHSWTTEKLEGQLFLHAIFSLFQDVEEFTLHLDSLQEKQIVDQILDQIHFSLEIFIGLAKVRNYLPNPEGLTLQQLAEQVLNQLLIKGNILLPGGYGSNDGTGHAVFYEIKKTAPHLYSFRIINTAISVSELKPGKLKDELNSYLEAERSLNEKYGHLSDYQRNTNQSFLEALDALLQKKAQFAPLMKEIKMEDVVFTDLTLDQLSPDFFQKLLSYHLGYEKCEMQDVLKFLSQNLERPQPNNKVLQGKKHSMQWNKGSCTTKSSAIWLHEQMKDPLYWKYKTHMNERYLCVLNQMLRDRNIYSKDLLQFAEKLRDYGHEMLAKRNDKKNGIFNIVG